MKVQIPFLLSVDVEEICAHGETETQRPARAPEMVSRYLAFLEERGLKITFFVLGSFAEMHPACVAALAAAGHEVACHGYAHQPLAALSPEALRDDIRRALEALGNAGAGTVRGYRAPHFSLAGATAWAHGVLRELGLAYSSSVLPAANPICGWPGFGRGVRAVEGVWEIPISLLPWWRLPFAGGVYFRCLPLWLIRRAFRRCGQTGEPVVGYLHPYDIDHEQERFLVRGVLGSHLFNALMYWHRRQTLDRLEAVLRLGCTCLRYADFVDGLGQAVHAGKGESPGITPE